MKRMLVFLFVTVLAGSVSAQSVDDAQIEDLARSESMGVRPAVVPFSLIDLSRVKWSHSYSVSFFSGGAYSGSMGLYSTTMFYDISSKLSLALNLGLAHNAGSLWGDGSSEATFLPGFRLDYHPSDKFHMTVGFQRYSGYFVPYYSPRYWDPIMDF